MNLAASQLALGLIEVLLICSNNMSYFLFTIAAMVFMVQLQFCVTSISVLHWPSYSTAYLYHQNILQSQWIYTILPSMAQQPQPQSHQVTNCTHNIPGQYCSLRGWWRVMEWCTSGQERQGGISFGASLTPFLSLPIAFFPDPFGYLSALSCRTQWIKKSCHWTHVTVRACSWHQPSTVQESSIIVFDAFMGFLLLGVI